MTWSGLVCGVMVLGGSGLCSAAEAIAPPEAAAPAGDANSSFPYAVIVTRNAFGLNPPPPPPAPPAAPGPDLPEVIFSGTVGVQGKLKAMFALKFKDPKKAQESPTYMSLMEGESSGPVQVIRIAPSGDEVEIMNSNTRMVMNMKDNGFEKKGPAAPGAPVPAGLRQLPGSPGIQLPGMPALPGAPAAGNDGGVINVGRQAGGPPRGGGISVQGAGSPTGGGPINPVAAVQPINNPSVASVAGNNLDSRVRITGTPTPPPNNPFAPNPALNNPTGAMPPNSTPPPTGPSANGQMPPIPPMPGGR